MTDPKKVKLQKRGSRGQSLGKGLGSLLSDVHVSKKDSEKENSSALSSAVSEIETDWIDANPYQPRQEFEQEKLEELADSIKIHGIIQPITVRKLEAKKYQLISGERRLQASKLAGLKTIPAFIRTANDQQMQEMALIENIQRENLNAIEIAHSYQRLIREFGLKQEELGDRVGKKRATVTNYLRLLKLPFEIHVAIKENQISFSHAKPLVNIEDSKKQLAIFDRIIAEDLSVRKVEEIVKNLKLEKQEEKPATKPQDTEFNFQIKRVQNKLATQFGTKVKIQSSDKGKGEIKIPFTSTDDLNRILELLNYSD